mmetsp:Transcript_28463/g.37211  ORF Transcript_28463/g.37211 Transcript_28463/m.37211 type:complete len:278 (-) Transcript_28463:278-1111(-)
MHKRKGYSGHYHFTMNIQGTFFETIISNRTTVFFACIIAVSVFWVMGSTIQKSSGETIDEDKVQNIENRFQEVQTGGTGENVHVIKFQDKKSGNFVSWRQAIKFWQAEENDDKEFLQTFIDSLKKVPFSAYYWETTPLSKNAQEMDFECAIVKAPYLEGVSPDIDSFQEHMNKKDCQITSFQNLGGDATLIVPYKQEGVSKETYTHIANFMRAAELTQIFELWKEVGSALNKVLSERSPNQRTWVSTSGAGVFWLHVRLDTRPKYYQYREFANREIT